MNRRKVAVRSTAAVAALALVSTAAIGWVGSERALRPASPHYKWTLADYPDLHPDKFKVHSATGIDLEGRFFPGSSRAMVILVSGYGDTEDLMLPYAEFLHQAGFNTLIYNARARGNSGGEYVTLGVLERIDLEGIVQYAASRPDVDPHKIGALGVSMGGATVIMTGAYDPTLRAIVDDCGFSDVQSVIASSFEHFIHLPAIPFAPITLWIASYRAGIDVDAIRPVDVIGKISPRPILIIHGKDDLIVPVSNSERNYQAAREPKQLWLVPGAKHAAAHKIAKAEYEKRVIAFFDKGLQ
jgi:fermentation-respiration switch protein FrsA (DUF1100 family)